MIYNVKMLVTSQDIDKLVKIQVLLKETLTNAFGENNVNFTPFFKSEKYKNKGFNVYVNVLSTKSIPVLQPIRLKEVEKDASDR